MCKRRLRIKILANIIDDIKFSKRIRKKVSDIKNYHVFKKCVRNT